jgi:prepilin-type N-terminal cleavage/methylation domain-containing protein
MRTRIDCTLTFGGTQRSLRPFEWGEWGARGERAGFTLIELLAVIVILGILMTVLLTNLSGVSDTAKVKMTSAYIKQLGAAISEYEDQFGDFPPSHFLEEWGSPPNATNMGAETLVLSMWSPKWGGTSLNEDRLVNTDNDETKRALAKFPKTALFELKDEWGNPIAYFHHRDYGREDIYVVSGNETGVMDDNPVKAVMSPMTKTYSNATSYQLISAGKDGKFGTEDDIGNWTPPMEEEKKAEPDRSPAPIPTGATGKPGKKK